jgi:hypothetical protein
MGIAETMAVLLIFVGTFAGGISVAANVHSTPGVVGFGFIIGAILGFVLSSAFAAVVFCFAQIERNTRGLRERLEEPTQYRTAPHF